MKRLTTLRKLTHAQAVEQLVFRVDPAQVEQVLELDQDIWTEALAHCRGFAGKEIWIDPEEPGEITHVIFWDSYDDWKAISSEVLADIQNRFSEKLGETKCDLTGELHLQKQLYRTHMVDLDTTGLASPGWIPGKADCKTDTPALANIIPFTTRTYPEYPKVDFPYDTMDLQRIYANPDLATYPVSGVQGSLASRIYGELALAEPRADRVYTFGSLVLSVDGKIAFEDNPAGPVIARANALDPVGAQIDFWMLNFYRANSDVIVAGAGTMHKEPDGTVCIMDTELEQERINRGLSAAPWVVIVSLDGTDVRWEDTLFDNQPTMFHSSPAAAPEVEKHLGRPYFTVGPYADSRAVLQDAQQIRDLFSTDCGNRIPVLLTGEGSRPSEEAFLTLLRVLGFERALIETPSYCQALMRKGMLDEFWLDMSCLFVGGEAMSIGKAGRSFTSIDHPHSQVLSIHMHSPSYFYFRHKLVYGVAPGTL